MDGSVWSWIDGWATGWATVIYAIMQCYEHFSLSITLLHKASAGIPCAFKLGYVYRFILASCVIIFLVFFFNIFSSFHIYIPTLVYHTVVFPQHSPFISLLSDKPMLPG